MARANPLWRDFSRDVEALAIFQGPGTYISPSWYPTKRETAIDDRAWLREFVERLTNRHEAGRRDPWKVTDAPPDFIETQLGAIIGLEIPIARLIGKWKVSRNRPPHDRAGVVDGLLHEGRHSAEAMADLVRRSGKE